MRSRCRRGKEGELMETVRAQAMMRARSALFKGGWCNDAVVPTNIGYRVMNALLEKGIPKILKVYSDGLQGADLAFQYSPFEQPI